MKTCQERDERDVLGDDRWRGSHARVASDRKNCNDTKGRVQRRATPVQVGQVYSNEQFLNFSSRDASTFPKLSISSKGR